MRSTKKRPMGAYWFKGSFHRTIFKDNDIILYVGVHKPRQAGTKNMETHKRDPRAFKPKVDVSVYTTSGGESFPMYVEDMSSLIAGIILLDGIKNGGDSTIMDGAKLLGTSWNSRPHIIEQPYLEFNPNEINLSNLINVVNEIGYTDEIDDVEPIRKKGKILWLKGSQILIKRPDRNDETKFHKDLLLIGKDHLNNNVLGLKKKFAWGKEYSRIVPLKENGAYFVASIEYMIHNRPKTKGKFYPLSSPTTMNNMVKDKIEEMKSVDLKLFELTDKYDAIASRLGIVNP